MRFLVIYAHPVDGSYQYALHRCATETLSKAGHEVDSLNLYSECFQPILTSEERRNYHDTAVNQTPVLKEIERIRNCEGIVLVFPTWWYGMPAILKGYFDRVWVPGFAFEVVGGRTRPLLNHIKRFGVVTTYGSPWWLNQFMGDPNRRVLMRGIRHLFSPNARTLWLAKHGLDHVTNSSRQRFLQYVERRLMTF